MFGGRSAHAYTAKFSRHCFGKLAKSRKYFQLLTWQHARRTVAGTPEDCRYSCGQHLQRFQP